MRPGVRQFRAFSGWQRQAATQSLARTTLLLVVREELCVTTHPDPEEAPVSLGVMIKPRLAWGPQAPAPTRHDGVLRGSVANHAASLPPVTFRGCA